jgi:hypothetical protein
MIGSPPCLYLTSVLTLRAKEFSSIAIWSCQCDPMLLGISAAATRDMQPQLPWRSTVMRSAESSPFTKKTALSRLACGASSSRHPRPPPPGDELPRGSGGGAESPINVGGGLGPGVSREGGREGGGAEPYRALVAAPGCWWPRSRPINVGGGLGPGVSREGGREGGRGSRALQGTGCCTRLLVAT